MVGVWLPNAVWSQVNRKSDTSSIADSGEAAHSQASGAFEMAESAYAALELCEPKPHLFPSATSVSSHALLTSYHVDFVLELTEGRPTQVMAVALPGEDRDERRSMAAMNATAAELSTADLTMSKLTSPLRSTPFPPHCRRMFFNLIQYVPTYNGGTGRYGMEDRDISSCSLVSVYWAQQCRQCRFAHWNVRITSQRSAARFVNAALSTGSERLTPIIDIISGIDVYQDLKSEVLSWHHILAPRIPPNKLNQL